MLAKNRASAFILTLVSAGFFLAAYVLMSRLLNRDFPPASEWNTWLFLLLAAVILVLVFFFSRSLIVMGLGEEVGFGWKGLLRWAAYGAITGGLLALLAGFVLDHLEENSFLYNIAEFGGGISIIALVYGLIFRTSVFKVGGEKASAEAGFNFLGWYFIIGGAIVAGVGWTALLVGAFKATLTVKITMVSAGVILIGLSSILMGAMMRSQNDNKVISRIFWLVVGLLLVGVAVALIAMRLT